MSPSRDSPWRSLWLGMLILAVLTFLEGGGLLRVGHAGIRPDLVLSAVIAWSFLTDSANGSLWGFVGGLMLDGISAGPFASHALALTLVGGLVGMGRLSLYADEQVWAAVSGVAGVAAFYLVKLLVLWLTGWPTPFIQTLRVIIVPSLALDTVCVLAMLPILRATSRRLFPARLVT